MKAISHTSARRNLWKAATLAISGIVFSFGALTATPVMADADEAFSITRGGRLYDKWYAEIDAAKPEGNHSAWPAANTAKSGDATWRCKSCHGWDYQGVDGAYASGSWMTGIKGVASYKGGDPAAVIAIMNDATHGLGSLMRAEDLEDLALFVTKGQFDMDPYIDRATKKAKGDAVRGGEVYGAMCLNCHGADGKLPKDMPALGGLATSNPWEIMHKVVFGQPKEKMPAMNALDHAISADVLAYLQTLPQK